MLETMVQQHPHVTGFLKYDLALPVSPAWTNIQGLYLCSAVSPVS